MFGNASAAKHTSLWGQQYIFLLGLSCATCKVKLMSSSCLPVGLITTCWKCLLNALSCPAKTPSASASANSHLVTSGALTVPSLMSFASMSSVASVQSTADRVAALLQETPQRTLLLGKGQVDAAQLLEIQQHHPHHQLRIEIEPLARHGMQQVRQHLHLLLIFMMLFVQGTNSDVAFHDSAYCRGAQIVLCPLPGNPCSA